MKPTQQPQPVTMLMLTPEQLGSIVEQAVARAVSGYDDEVLKPGEAARVLRISLKTLQRRVKSGDLVPHTARPMRFLKSALVRR